jgi:hypothetical protein
VSPKFIVDFLLVDRLFYRAGRTVDEQLPAAAVEQDAAVVTSADRPFHKMEVDASPDGVSGGDEPLAAEPTGFVAEVIVVPEDWFAAAFADERHDRPF